MIEEISDAMILSVNNAIESWIFDLGAFFYAILCPKIMENYISGDFQKIHLTDDKALKIIGKRDIWLKFSNQTI